MEWALHNKHSRSAKMTASSASSCTLKTPRRASTAHLSRLADRAEATVRRASGARLLMNTANLQQNTRQDCNDPSKPHISKILRIASGARLPPFAAKFSLSHASSPFDNANSERCRRKMANLPATEPLLLPPPLIALHPGANWKTKSEKPRMTPIPEPRRRPGVWDDRA
jgi:hypothetical protein